ncbi:putative inorganic phosphate cotransporter [Galleria mellonella]|uniref:Inorganic phosphate cotransporter n=1 Tax=Galleria mellonella TaxID=7137 RepID=A0ABM3M8C5_GALME|nr:putative inorganic phosphate cotransporter [Galleria mellonella]
MCENTEHSGECVKTLDVDINYKGWGYRYQQCLILFLSLTVAYSMRSCMGVSLVAMIQHDIEQDNGNHTNVAVISNNNNNTEEYPHLYVNEDNYKAGGFFNVLMLTPPYPKLKWNKRIQDTVLTSFFWGYMLLQIPAGQIAHRFGSTYLLCSALSINCVVSLCFPLAVFYGGWKLAIACRILQGLSQSFIVPSIHTTLGKWAPLVERGRMTATVYGAQALGTVLGLPITGFIAASSMGWPGIFRFYGVLSGIMAGIMLWFGADSPAKHSKISEAERLYIQADLGQKEYNSNKRLHVPWKHILRCRGLYAVIIVHIGQVWGQLILYSEVPMFMDKVMGINIKANGLLTALPFLVMWFTNFFFSWFSDMLIVKQYLSVTNTRKLANSLGCVPAALGLIALAYVPKNLYAVETILVFICAFKISAHVGFQVNPIDISPNFGGTMMSISNFGANLVGSLAPIATGLILTDIRSEQSWGHVFLVTSAIYFFTNLIYVLVGTAELADWNTPGSDEEKKVDDQEASPMISKVKNNINNT